MKRVSALILSIILSVLFLQVPITQAQQTTALPSILPPGVITGLSDIGYSCTGLQMTQTISAYSMTYGSTGLEVKQFITCTLTYTNYTAARPLFADHLTLQGTATSGTSTKDTVISDTIYFLTGNAPLVMNSPFLYLHHPPEGTVSISLSSPLDQYFPKPAFNQKNGWQVQAKDNSLSVNGVQETHLFYELATPAVTLTRKGRNFSSKSDLTTFLTTSDFFTRMGFSPEEKQSSLSYLLPKIKAAPTTPNYYLTILDQGAVEAISHLHITPKPDTTLRYYLALYPSAVPVQTTGDFSYPQMREEGNSFVAKETGEIVVTEGMVVLFR